MRRKSANTPLPLQAIISLQPHIQLFFASSVLLSRILANAYASPCFSSSTLSPDHAPYFPSRKEYDSPP